MVKLVPSAAETPASSHEVALLDSKRSSASYRPASPGAVFEGGWDAVLSLCKTKMSPADFSIVCQLGSVEELVQFGSILQSKYRETTKAYELARLTAFFRQLRTFHSSLDVFIHVKPTVAAPLWGSIRLCVDLIHETNEVFQMIVDMFGEINHTLPRIGTYIEILGESPTLVEPSREVYSLIAEFACQVIIYFRKTPLKNLLLATWKPFRPDFEKIISRIRQKSRQIELEAQTLSLQKDTVRYEEIKRLLTSVEIKSRVQLPYYYIPYSKNPSFVGREDVLGDIQSHLNGGSGSQRVVSLYGLGGVGKTQISLEYLSQHKDDYAAIFWISADTVIKLSQDIRTILTKLGLVGEDSKENNQQCRTVFGNWLQETDEKWLLVFDNADDLKTLKGYWPISKHGHILLTSRDPASSRLPFNSTPIKGIQVLSLSDSKGADLLLGLLNQDTLQEHDLITVYPSEETSLAEDLAKQLGGLPLAINQVAHYMLEAECGLEEIVEIYSDFRDRSSLLEQDQGNLHMDYEHSLGTVWEVSMSRIEQANENSFHLLQILALFDPDGVPEKLLDGSDRQRKETNMANLTYLENKLQYLNATRPLLQQSMISKNKTDRTLSMHRLVGTVTQSKMAPDDRQARFDEALELIYRAYPQITIERASLNDQWPRCRLYLPQVMSLERYYRESDSPLIPRANFATVLANASWFLLESGIPGQAMQILPTARAVGEATISGNELPVATIYRTLGGIYLDICKPQAGLDSFSRQLQVAQMLESPEGLAVAHGYANVALGQTYMEDYAAARESLDKAQEVRSRYPGQAESYRAMTLEIIGILDGLEGEYLSGVEHVKEALRLYDDELGVGNWLSAFANFSLGNLYIGLGLLDEAFKHHTIALSIRRATIGSTYRTAASLHKVAWHLHSRDDNAGAEELLLQALTIYANTYEGKGGIGRSSYLMSMVLQSLNREQDASNTKTLAGEIRQQILGIPPDQDDNLQSYNKLVGTQDR